MRRLPSGAPSDERGGRLRGALDLIAGRYPRFVFGGQVGDALPVFHFHETTRERLAPAFAYLVDNGYRTVTSDDAAALARDGRRPGSRTVMLAFDDAWASLWLIVGPLLREYGLRAVAYAIPVRIQDAPAPRPLDVQATGADRATNPFVTWPELKTLASSGIVDVQSHTWSHSMIFTGDRVLGRVTSAFADEPFLNRPRIDDGTALTFLSPEQMGYPLFARRSRMSDGLRFFPDLPAGASTNGPAPVKGRWETADAQARAIEHELVDSRDVLEQQLGVRVRHACLPWGVSGVVARRALERTGYLSAFANQLPGRFAVAAGDDPYFLKRLNERHVYALPGRGRKSFTLFA